MPTKTTLYWVGLTVAVAAVGFVCGAEYGSPVYDITEIVWVSWWHTTEPFFDGVRCFIP